MDTTLLLQVVQVIYMVLWLALLVRVLLTWFPAAGASSFGRVIYQLTEPILGPIRRVLPKTGMLDLSPLIAFILLLLIREIVVRLLSA